MDSVNTYWADRSALEWHVDLGVLDAIGDLPVNRYDVPEKAEKPAPVAETPATPVPEAKVNAATEAATTAAGAVDLSDLRSAIDGFAHCTLKRGARNTVFAQGDPAARVMIIGDAPDREADRAGLPFANGPAQLLNRMFDAIGMGLEADQVADRIYLAAPMPWRPTTQPPQEADMQMMAPFLHRHIGLADPDVVVVMGNTACQMVLGHSGVSRLRGSWTEALGRPVLPMVHPASLMQTPTAKREAWVDLLALKAKLKDF